MPSARPETRYATFEPSERDAERRTSARSHSVNGAIRGQTARATPALALGHPLAFRGRLGRASLPWRDRRGDSRGAHLARAGARDLPPKTGTKSSSTRPRRVPTA